jgi:hypothetical protein
MSIHRYAAKRDQNEPELVLAAERLGAKVWRLSTPCDLLVLFGGQWFPVEIKSTDGRLTKPQREFVTEADLRAGQVLVWRTIQDVINSLGAE